MAVVHLADYRPAPYLLERTDLTVRLFADHALVEARLARRRGRKHRWSPWSSAGWIWS